MKKNKLYGYNVQEIERKKVNEVTNVKSDEDFAMTKEFYDILGDEKRNKKGKKKSHIFTILILFLVIFGIGGLGFLAYIKVYFTADRFLDDITKDYNTYIENLNTFTNYVPYNLNDGYELSGELNFASNMPIYENLNTLNLIYDAYIDISEEKAFYDLALEHEDSSLISGEMYIDKNNFYYNIPDFLSKTILINAEEEPITLDIFTFNMMDFLKIPSYILETLEYANKSTINKGLTNIYRYEINDNNKDAIINKFKDLINANDSVSSLFNFLYGKDYLDNISIENLTLEIEVNVITKDIVGFSFNGYGDSLLGERKTDNKFRITDSVGDYIDIDIYEDRCNITMFIDGKTNGQINITHSDNEINVNMLAEDTTIELKLTDDEKNSNLHFNITYLDASIILNLDMSTQDEKINTTGVVNVEYSGAKLGIEFNNSLTFDVEVPIKIYEDYINVDELTEEDAEEIADGLNKFLNNLPDELTYIILTLISSEEQSAEIPEHTI